MQPLRIGIAGAGGIAQRNAREAAASGAAVIAGVFDVNHKAARDMAKALGAPFCASYEELLASSEVEAVLLSTPHHLHSPMTIQAARAGKHVLVEKPIANNLREAEQMIAACRSARVRLAVNYSFRYLSKLRRARELIAAGALGEIAGIQIVNHQYKDQGYWSGARSNSPDNWRASREKCGGGFLIMNVCHVIDYLYFLTGLKAVRISSEYATLGSPAEVEDIISVSCKWSNGAIGSISASSIMRGADNAEERIWGTNGTLIIHGEGLSLYSTRPVEGLRPGKLHKLTKFPAVSWTAEWVKEFAAAVRNNAPAPVGEREGWENLAFIETAYASMTQQRALEVPSFAL
jgi:predicted dehydrogenase